MAHGVQSLLFKATGIAIGCSLAIAMLLWTWDALAAKGFLLGAAAGILPFWLFGRQVERQLQTGGEVEVVSIRWTLARVGLAILALLQAYYLDPTSRAGILAALGGLFVMRAVVVALALTGLDERWARR